MTRPTLGSALDHAAARLRALRAAYWAGQLTLAEIIELRMLVSLELRVWIET